MCLGHDEIQPAPVLTHNKKTAGNAGDNKQPSVRLYDIEADPTESFDVASYFPRLVDEFLGKIAAYNFTAVPVSFPDCDPLSDPSLRDGVWGPWV